MINMVIFIYSTEQISIHLKNTRLLIWKTSLEHYREQIMSNLQLVWYH